VVVLAGEEDFLRLPIGRVFQSVDGDEVISSVPTPLTNAKARRRWIPAALFAIAAWVGAGWWVGPVESYWLPQPANERFRILGFTEDGDLLMQRTEIGFGPLGVWKWELPACQKTEIWSTPMDPGRISSISLSDGGRWLVVNFSSQDEPSETVIVDLRTGARLKDVPHGISSWISEDGRVLLTKTETARIEVTDFPSGRSLGHLEEFDVAGISPDGQWVACYSGGATRLWRITPGGLEPTSVVESKDSSTPQCRFNHDGTRLLILGNGLSVWDLKTLKVIHSTAGGRVVSDTRFAYFAEDSFVNRMDTESGNIDRFEFARSADHIDLLSCSLPWLFIRSHNEFGPVSPLVDFRVGPVHIEIDASVHQELTLVNFETRERIRVRRDTLQGSTGLGGFGWFSGASVWQVAQHSRRVATQIGPEYSTHVRIIEIPPQRPWLKQAGLALLLFGLPGWWCWRGKRVSAPSQQAPISTVTIGTA
jgi:hypothetical protein